MSPASSSRWCPTPEQLMILEEMYRGGTRTPNASQIQQITAHLSFYGKIEGKNVFYWFQNHKARDRQKLRRKLSKQMHQQQQLLYHHHHHHHHHPNIQQNHHHSHHNHHNHHHPNPNIQQNNHHHHLLHYLDQSSPPPPAAASAQVSHYSPVGFLPQGGVEGGASTQMTSCSPWKMQGRHLPDQGLEMENKSMGMGRTCGCDWMMMMDVGPTPLKTLELFPISATALKDEHTTTPSSASTNY